MNAPSWIGRTLGGRYQIEELLGQGGMSAVYKGNDPNLRRAVAIKLIHSHLSTDQHFLHRFEEEAAAVAQLRHPNIIQVYDFNQDQGTYYMVMEFVPGETLQDRLRRYNRSQRFIPLDKTIQYIQQICAAIDYAHKRGMIHRDIKPANIMIDVHDQAILMDFGIAKMVGAEKFTATGAVVGTALYMPPEAIRGETADARSDIYSLGITLYEIISGKPPFEASSAMTLMMMHLNDPVPDLSSMRPDIPRELVAVIERSLAKDRVQRFATAAEMSAALQGVLARLPGETAAFGLVEPPAPGAPVKNTPASPARTAGITPSDSHTEIEQTAPPIPRQSAATQLENSPMPPWKPPAAGTAAGMAPGAAVQPAAGRPAQTAVSSVSPAGMPGRAQGSAPASASPARPSGAPVNKAPFKLNLVLIALIGAAALVVLIGVILGGIALARSIQSRPTQTPALVIVTTLPVVAAAPSATPSPTPTNTPTPTITHTPAPSATPSPTLSPTPTLTPTPDLYVVIKSITIENNRYVVEYETFGYEEKLPGRHVHFFFNNITPENAGMPGSGPWKLYGGPRPFKDYKVSDRPNDATQICALVANANHSIILNSGTCLDLPK